jgi:molybdopterin converting factor subunit 1
MTVRVLLFARAAELAGASQTTVDLAEGATVADLRSRLGESYPRLAPFLPRCAVALGGELARDDQALTAGAEVALLPPVSGG